MTNSSDLHRRSNSSRVYYRASHVADCESSQLPDWGFVGVILHSHETWNGSVHSRPSRTFLCRSKTGISMSYSGGSLWLAYILWAKDAFQTFLEFRSDSASDYLEVLIYRRLIVDIFMNRKVLFFFKYRLIDMSPFSSNEYFSIRGRLLKFDRKLQVRSRTKTMTMNGIRIHMSSRRIQQRFFHDLKQLEDVRLNVQWCSWLDHLNKLVDKVIRDHTPFRMPSFKPRIGMENGNSWDRHRAWKRIYNGLDMCINVSM